MLKILPIAAVVVAILGISGYLIFTNRSALKPHTTPQAVPSLPPAPALESLKGQAQSLTVQTTEEQLKLLTQAVLELKGQLDQLKQTVDSTSVESETEAFKTLEENVAGLQTQVAQLKLSPSTSSGKSPVGYIPLGVGGQAGNTDWYTLTDYEITIDPADYPGYSSMQLEVNFRLETANGTGYARLLNVTDNSDVGVTVNTTVDQFDWYQTYYFKPASGKKVYQMQIKSVTGTRIYVQNARIRVNF